MGKLKRVPRKNLSKTMNVLQPITLDQLGTKDDPCFGKLFDPRCNECQRCGDSEICAIAMGQLNHALRAKTEEKGNFKDLEEKNIKKVPKKKALKELRIQAKFLIKANSKEGIKKDVLIEKLYEAFKKDDIRKPLITKKVNGLLNRNESFITIKNNRIKWKTKNPSK